jgi:hypothetical protein
MLNDKLKRLSRILQQLIWPLLPLPLGIKRILWHKLLFSKNRFAYKDAENVFSKIYTDNVWLSEESRSGGGSLISATKTIRDELPVLWKKYKIKTFLDVPCGDYNWMKEVDKTDITYIGGDVVNEMIEENNKKYSAENVSFRVIDITKSDLPTVDMIFCKDCLQHLSYENIFKALKNFKKSNSKYLLTTSYSKTLYNWDIFDGDCRPLNLLKKPFCLPEPVMIIREKSRGGGWGVDNDKDMYLYDLNMIN